MDSTLSTLLPVMFLFDVTAVLMLIVTMLRVHQLYVMHNEVDPETGEHTWKIAKANRAAMERLATAIESLTIATAVLSQAAKTLANQDGE